jgi:lysyl-tRNA synthetase class 2
VGDLVRRLSSPTWLARIVAFVGVVSVASALSPELDDRTALVAEIVPPVFPAAATTGALAVGTVLVLLGGGLRRGGFRAWLISVVLCAVVVVLHLVKGLDVEEAAMTGAVLVLLLVGRRHFTALPGPRSLRRLAAVVLLGVPMATVLGWAWLSADLDTAAHTSARQRLAQAFLGLFGMPGPLRFSDAVDADRSAVALVVLGATVLLLAVAVALQPASGPHRLQSTERHRVIALLDRWGSVDSLSYFALRDDRSVIFSPTGKAAISYRVVGTVSLAASDPVGDPEAWPCAIATWLAEAQSYGWVPAVLGASERGAEAYHRAGFDALELGDEAVLHVDGFTLAGRGMRSVRQAVSRCRRAGLTVSCRRADELTPQEGEEIVSSADAWRDGGTERGFSMALGRLLDERAVIVTCRDGEGRLRGLLQLVPWGSGGLSLDVMRRDRASENGVVELMVTQLMADAGRLGVSRVSLNFAVFRGVFARGERLGAGPVLRLWRAVLLQASRFWQIESLYRANAKFQPEWVPRFVCFRSSAEVPRISVAALRAEAFLTRPSWCRRPSSSRRHVGDGTRPVSPFSGSHFGRPPVPDGSIPRGAPPVDL